MSKLFDSEIVQKEMDEMTSTYMDLMMKVPYFPVMSREQREEVIDDLELLVDRQETLYSRAYLMNDEDSQLCLLYTSPSPRDMWTSSMPSSA